MLFEMAQGTDVGRQRKSNQDYLCIEPDNRFAIVADGIGGRNAGNVASKIAVTSMAQILRSGIPSVDTEIPEFLVQAVDKVNAVIWETAAKKDHFTGMGTTMECMLFANDQIYISHIGDSRTYLYYEENLWPLTIDHNLLTFIEKGWIRKSAASKKVKQTAMVRALGLEAHCECDVYRKKIQPGEIYFSASDGLFDMVKEQQMISIIKKNYGQVSNIVSELIHAANKNGGRDNISVVLTKVK